MSDEKVVIAKDGWQTVVKAPAAAHEQRTAARTIIDRDGWQTAVQPKVLEEFRSELTSDPADLRMPPMPDPAFGRAIGAPQAVLTAPIRKPMLPVATPIRNMPASGNIPDLPLLRIPRTMFVREEKAVSDPHDPSRATNVTYRAVCARGTYDVDMAIRPPGALLHEYVARHLGQMDTGEVFADGLRLDGSPQDGLHAALNKTTRLLVEVPEELQAGPGILDLPLVGTVSSYPFTSPFTSGMNLFLSRIPQLHAPTASINEAKKFGQGGAVKFAFQKDISTNWTVWSAAGGIIREKRPRFPALLIIDYLQTWTGYVRIDRPTNRLVAERISLTKSFVIT